MFDEETYGAAVAKAKEIAGNVFRRVDVSGITPSITASANTLYQCGEVSTLSFTPSNDGVSEVIFTSGTTPTVLTMPNTVKFPYWFDPTSLMADTIYEISVLNGLATVAEWGTSA